MTIVLLRKFSMVGRMKITWLNDTLHTYIEQYDCQCRFTNAQSIWEFNSKNFVSHFSDVSEWAHFRLRTTMLRGNFEKLPNRTMNYSQCVCATSEINKIWQHRRRKKNVCINSMYAFDSVFLIFDAVAWLGRATLKSGITKTHNVLFATRIFSSFHSFRFLHTELVRDFFFFFAFYLFYCSAGQSAAHCRVFESTGERWLPTPAQHIFRHHHRCRCRDHHHILWIFSPRLSIWMKKHLRIIQ